MILVFGRTGQVARELERLSEASGLSLVFLSRAEADLANPSVCASSIETMRPSAVINAAAWTAVDAAESDEATASIVNGEAPGAMARACARRSIPFMHISSDYVFDGSWDSLWAPSDPPAPLGAYGRSKWLGEQKVVESGAHAVVLRTSWVFSAHGANFVKTMLRLGAEREALSVVDDQIGGPTSAASIARALLKICDALRAGQGGGIFHFAGAPFVSWAGFAQEIMAQAKLPCAIEPIPSSAYPTVAPRPLNSRLDCSATERAFSLPQPSWQADLAEVLSELGFPA